jgi:hypothetical protein
VCAFSTCRICGRTGLAVCRAINVGCSCPISDLSVRPSQRPPPPPLRPCPGRAHEPPSAPNPVDLWATQERASPTNPQVQQQQQASAYSVRNGVERVPTLDPHADPVSEIHRPASRRTPRAGSSWNPGRHHLGTVGGIIPESPGGLAGMRTLALGIDPKRPGFNIGQVTSPLQYKRDPLSAARSAP